MENKNSKGLVVAVVILSVLVVVLGAYIGYDKFLNKEEIIKSENKEKNSNSTKSETAKTDESEEKTNESEETGKITNSQTTVKCYGTYYENGDMNGSKYILNENGTYSVEGEEEFGAFTINENTITFIQMKHTTGPRDEDPIYENPRSYLISDDCSTIRLTPAGSEISAELKKIN